MKRVGKLYFKWKGKLELMLTLNIMGKFRMGKKAKYTAAKN